MFSTLPPPPEKSSKTEQLLLTAVIVSLVVHLIILLSALSLPLRPQKTMEFGSRDVFVDLVPSNKRLPVVETLQETAKEPVKDAQFASDRDLKAEEETSPDGLVNSAPQVGGSGAQSKPKTSKSQTVGVGDKKPIISMSKADLLNDSTSQDRISGAGPKGVMSRGFQERVKKGDELKLNAHSFDYGQYINRMRVKLSQRWNPQQTIVPQMYQQRTVRVDVIVVLNNQGEIVELNTKGPSRFTRFDDEALRALRAAAPFPNPPDSLIQDDHNVYLTWSFILSMDSWGVGAGSVE